MIGWEQVIVDPVYQVSMDPFGGLVVQFFVVIDAVSFIPPLLQYCELTLILEKVIPLSSHGFLIEPDHRS